MNAKRAGPVSIASSVHPVTRLKAAGPKSHVKDSLGCLSIPWIYNGYTEDDNGELAC